MNNVGSKTLNNAVLTALNRLCVFTRVTFFEFVVHTAPTSLCAFDLFHLTLKCLKHIVCMNICGINTITSIDQDENVVS